MRRELPPRPHLQHLKKQAKELLDAWRHGDSAARKRFAEALPMLRRKSTAELSGIRLKLHDAQSVIAREYGYDSWRVLRGELARRADQRIMDSLIAQHLRFPLTPDVMAALTSSLSGFARARLGSAHDIPEQLPLVAIRDFMVCPRTITPLHFKRQSSLGALDAATRMTSASLGAFAQRDSSIEEPAASDLYEVGCQVRIRSSHPQPGDVTVVILEGVRWIRLHELGSSDGYRMGRVEPARSGEPDEADDDEVAAAATGVSKRACRLASVVLPEPERAVELIESVATADQLGDLVIANMKCAIADKARYAAERDLLARMQIVTELLDAQLAPFGDSAR